MIVQELLTEFDLGLQGMSTKYSSIGKNQGMSTKLQNLRNEYQISQSWQEPRGKKDSAYFWLLIKARSPKKVQFHVKQICKVKTSCVKP